MRQFQRYTVTIHHREISRLLAPGDVIEILPGLFVKTNDLLYHPQLGLLAGQDAPPMPASARVVSD